MVFLASCSQILQTVDLDINTKDNSVQEAFNVIEKTLTIKEAQKQKNSPYSRIVIQSGRGENAQPVPEKLALSSNFPKNRALLDYKVGVGDTILFSRLIENNRSPRITKNEWPKQKLENTYIMGIGDSVSLTMKKDDKSLTTPMSGSDGDDNRNVIISSQQQQATLSSTGRIGSDGSVLLLEVGRLEASGKSLNELRSEVRNILIRNGVSPRFQLEIVAFKSQKAYLTVNSTSRVIFLDDQRTTVKDILASANVGFKSGVNTRIRLQRDNKEYSMSLRKIYSLNGPNVDIMPSDHILVEDSSAKIMTTSSVVDHEGSVVFEGVGKIKAAGRTLNALRTEIKTSMQKVPDSQNAFQIQITQFSSQTALLSIPGKPGAIIKITDSPAALSDVLTKNGLNIDETNIAQIILQRNDDSYVFTLDDLLNPNSPKVYVQPGDQITTKILPYKENKVFILGGVAPQIFKINPANRETLADILFTAGGPLSAVNAKRSEVYLLRGNSPVVAYHLDAQSPTRLIVADSMELRPNDILYVAEQPIVSFNRTLATIVPLRLLLRDIQDENIP